MDQQNYCYALTISLINRFSTDKGGYQLPKFLQLLLM